VENSPLLTSRGLHRVLGDLASLGFDARWGVVSAAAVGAPHKRDRIWILANAKFMGWEKGTEERGTYCSQKSTDNFGNCGSAANVAHANSTQRKGRGISRGIYSQHSNFICPSWWDVEPNVGRVAHGVAARVDRLKAIGNGQVPAVAATAWRMLTDQ